MSFSITNDTKFIFFEGSIQEIKIDLDLFLKNNVGSKIINVETLYDGGYQLMQIFYYGV